jgi:hypothetical protein
MKTLSARGSSTLPSSVTELVARAIAPSKKSVEAPTAYRITAVSRWSANQSHRNTGTDDRRRNDRTFGIEKIRGGGAEATGDDSIGAVTTGPPFRPSS